MKISVKNIIALSEGEIALKLESLDSPALLFDNNLKLIAKNRKASFITSFIRRGVKLNRFVPEGEIESFFAMNWGETKVCEFGNDSEKTRATFVCGNGWLLAILNPIDARLRERVNEIYAKMSGHDIVLKEKLRETEDISENRKRIAYLVESVFSTLKNSNELPFFDPFAITENVIEKISEASKTVKNRISFIQSGKRFLAEGNECDYALICAFVVAFCGVCCEDAVEVSLNNRAESLVLTVSGKGNGDNFYRHFENAYSGSHHLLSNADFWAYMLKLIADSNLWDFNFKDFGEGEIGFSLSMSLVKVGEEFKVRDIIPERISEMISVIFGEILDSFAG